MGTSKQFAAAAYTTTSWTDVGSCQECAAQCTDAFACTYFYGLQCRCALGSGATSQTSNSSVYQILQAENNDTSCFLELFTGAGFTGTSSTYFEGWYAQAQITPLEVAQSLRLTGPCALTMYSADNWDSNNRRGTLMEGAYDKANLTALNVITSSYNLKSFQLEPLRQQYGADDSRCGNGAVSTVANQGACQRMAGSDYDYYDYNRDLRTCAVTSSCGSGPRTGYPGYSAFNKSTYEGMLLVQIKLLYYPTLCVEANGFGEGTRMATCDNTSSSQLFRLPFFGVTDDWQIKDSTNCLVAEGGDKDTGTHMVTGTCAGTDRSNNKWGPDHTLLFPRGSNLCWGTQANPPVVDTHILLFNCDKSQKRQLFSVERATGLATTTRATTTSAPTTSTTRAVTTTTPAVTTTVATTSTTRVATTTLATTTPAVTTTTVATTTVAATTSSSSSSTTGLSTSTIATTSSSSSSSVLPTSTTARTTSSSSSTVLSTSTVVTTSSTTAAATTRAAAATTTTPAPTVAPTTTTTSRPSTSTRTTSTRTFTTTTRGSTDSTTRGPTTTTTSTAATTPPPAVALAPSPPPCADRLEFRDQRGLGCGDWQGQNCSELPASGYDASGLKAVQDNCPVSCGVCVGTAAPKVVIQQLKQVAFGMQVAIDLSQLSQADRESAMKASMSAALGVDPSSIASVTVEEVPGRRLQTAQPKYNVRCEVVVPPSAQARSIIMQATALSDPNSDAFSSFGSAMATAGVDTSTLAVAVTTKPSTSTVSVAVNSDGTLAALPPSSPAPAPGGNSTASSGGTAQAVVTADCQDNPNFVDEQGEGCSGWVGYACDSVTWLKTEKPYTVNGLLSVQAQCPLSCGTCAPPGRPSPAQLAATCADDVYTAAWCLRWRGMNCSDATSLGYSASYQQLLLGLCPLSCGLCGSGAPALADIPGFQDELGNNCSSWRGSDCTKMYANYTRKGMLMVQTACQDSCFNSSRRRLAATCEDDPKFSYIQRYSCQDFVGRICTYGTLYLNVRWLLGPRGSLAWHENIWGHCPVACGRCDPEDRPKVADLLTECQDDPYIENWCGYTWKGQDCHHWSQSVNLVVPNEGERFNATLLGRCPSTCRLCTPPVCAAGTYRDARRHVCSECAPGSYMATAASGPGALACALARPGFAVGQRGGVAEEPCALGTAAASSGQGSCDACGRGRYADRRAMDSCTACSAGWFQAGTGASACERCPMGTYGDGTGLSACTSCPAEFTTLLEGATSAAICGCLPGQWRPLNSSGCEDCPPGMFCPGGHGQFDKGPDMTAQLPPGMMSLQGAVDSVYTCTAAEETCPGYRPLPYTADLFSEVCPGNLTGPRCSECPPDFYLTDDGVCGDCRADKGVWGAGLNIVIGFLAGIYSAERTYRSCARFRSEGQFMFFGILSFAQGLVPVIKMPLMWPRIFSVVFSIIIPFSVPGLFDLWSFNFQLKCFIGQGFIIETVKNVTLPLLMFVNVGMLYVVFPFTCRKVSRPMAMCCLAQLWDGAWIALCVMAIMLFPTDTMPNGKEFLRYNPSVEIGSQEWKVSLPLGLAAILLYVCSYLAYTISGVCNAPRYFVQRAGFGDAFGFIIYVYRPEAYWWGLVLYTTNFAYVLIQLFGNVYWQIYVTLFVGIAMVLLEVHVYPSIFLQMNRVNVAMKSCNAFFVILAVCFIDTRAVEATAYTYQIPRILMGIGLGVSGVFVLTAVHAMFLGVGQQKWRAVHNQRQAHKARAVMTLVTAMPEKKFIPALLNFFDSDWEVMQEYNQMLTAVFLEVQSGSRWWQQRIIRGARPGVYDRQQVARMAHNLVCQHLVGAAMDQNMELHRLLDRLQDLVVDMADDEGLNPTEQPVSAAVAAALSQKDLKHNLTHAINYRDRRDKANAEPTARSGSWLRRLLPLADSPAVVDEKVLQAEHHASLQLMEEVPVTAERFLQEFGGRHGFTEEQLLRLFQAFDIEKDGEVPLARIVAMVLSHAHSQTYIRKIAEGLGEEDVVVEVPGEFGSEEVPGEAGLGGQLTPHSRVAPSRPALQPRLCSEEYRLP